jgi:hypothetical protein
MTPDEFATKMRESFPSDDSYFDVEEAHAYADDVMCDILIELGYGEGVEIFKKARKWYA